MFAKEVGGGGTGPEYAASIILFLAKAKLKDGNDAKEQTGIIVTAKQGVIGPPDLVHIKAVWVFVFGRENQTKIASPLETDIHQFFGIPTVIQIV